MKQDILNDVRANLLARHNNPNMCPHDNKASKYLKQNLTELKEINRQINIFGDLTLPVGN